MDREAAERLGLPTAVLMENAGRGAAERILTLHGEHLGCVILVGGVGQNGGDAWVVARHLALAGVRTLSFVVSPGGRACEGDAAVMLRAARAMGLAVSELGEDLGPLREALQRGTLVVDGLFGTGLAREVTGVHAGVIAMLAEAGLPVVALDLPSGIDADDGRVLGVALPATTTLTFGAEKRGLHAGPGALHAGRVEVVSIGAPVVGTPRATITELAELRACVAPRAADAHKGTAGHVLVVGGDAGTTGAALLAAHGALRAGAGLVSVAARREARASYDSRVLEVMTREFDSAGSLLAFCAGKRAVVLGPGLGRDASTDALVADLARDCPVPLVLDADALTLLARRGLETLRVAAAPRILTPHPGEAARLLAVEPARVQSDRFAAVEALAARSGQVVVLKGARTLVAGPRGPIRVCDRGGPMLGVGGSGDVLAGMIAAVVDRARPEGLEPSVAAAVLWHALAGEVGAVADRGLLAHEIADAAPEVLRRVRAESA